MLVRRDPRIPYFRRSIPKTLRARLGRREFICSLRTSEAPDVAASGDIRWTTDLTDENFYFTSGTCSKP
ncbi:DUF6538 domain-containing protein [Paraburkholderia kirstenboschensis]|uniref:DUF6538 domain-containing protein n=1 Tax=Paraburkholderia kirstenboschensis TaxID=1245436 RepID=UPI0037424F33